MAINSIVAFITTLTSLVTILFQVSLWQRKEYRWDRMYSYLTSAESRWASHPWLIAAIMALGLSWISFLIGSDSSEVIALAAITFFAIHHALRIQKQGLYRPIWTLKSLTVMAITVGLSAGYISLCSFPGILPYAQQASFLFFLPGICTVAVVLANIPFGIRKRLVATKAAARRSQLKNLQVIGITGSYGKTSTKYFLSQILGKTQLPFSATPEHCNSYYCIAQHLLKNATPTQKVYVAEMGAYRPGEIKQITDIVKPTIGVITAVGSQHISLFGSPEAVLTTKWELARSLPKAGTLIINGDNGALVAKAKKGTRKIIQYSCTHAADIWLEDMAIQDTSIHGSLHIYDKKYPVSIPLISQGLLGSALAAVAAATVLDIGHKTILAAISSLSPMSRTMEGYAGPNKSFVVDDSYSGGHEAALNAIQHIKNFRQKDKRIVFVPIIELGEKSAAAHVAIGAAIAETGARLYIYGDAHRADIEAGLGKQASNAAWFSDALRLTESVTSGLSSSSLVLLEGRVPSLLRQALSMRI
ncbi:MAG: hypothetical protein HYZ62_01335 [Candidatus Andersenbacteria bacterium]|nr:hypothetical protein [Candidatus Andersenbacteria bacterium]